MSTNPVYTVTPLAGSQTAVRIETMVPQSPFHDESYPIDLLAMTPDALPLLQVFLSGLSLNSSWTSRESRATAYLKEGTLADGRTHIELHQASSSIRIPDAWYCIMSGETDYKLLEINVRGELLAHQIFDALLAGSLQLRFAEPDPV